MSLHTTRLTSDFIRGKFCKTKDRNGKALPNRKIINQPPNITLVRRDKGLRYPVEKSNPARKRHSTTNNFRLKLDLNELI